MLTGRYASFVRMTPLNEGDIEKLGETHTIVLLEACNSTIYHLNKTLKQQSRQKRLLEKRIFALRGKRSFLNRIPDKLMLEIFKEAAPENSLALGPILRVCKKWYRLAVGSPSLWTTISIYFQSTPHVIGIRRGTQYLESAIRYSKAAPLDFDLILPQELNLVGKMVTGLFNAIDRSEDPEDTRSDNVYEWLQGAIERDCEGLLFHEELIEAVPIYGSARELEWGKSSPTTPVQTRLRPKRFQPYPVDHSPVSSNTKPEDLK
jgi:hypothetical protein